MTLAPAQVSALRELQEIWSDRSVVIIGATALGFYHDMKWRQTADVDLLVAVELDEFPSGLDELDGWEQHPKKEHEFMAPGNVKLDILPAGPEILKGGTIKWKGGHVMNMAAMGLAFQHAEVHSVDGYHASVAPVPVVALLKMTAYLDRPTDRLRDLEDIAHLLDGYVDDDSDRRWDDAADIGEFDLAPAYLLGLDMGKLGDRSHRGLIESFLDRVVDPDGTEHAQMQRRGPVAWSSQSDPLAKRLTAFGSGLAATEK